MPEFSAAFSRRRFWFFLALVSFIMISCQPEDDADHSGSGDDDSAEDDSAGDDSGPADGGDDSADDIDESIRTMLSEYLLFTGEPGLSIGYRIGDAPPKHFSEGLSDLKTGKLLVPAMVFRAGSLTKVSVAAIVLQLADEGRLSLDDALTDHLPEYEGWSEITLRHLLAMRSGLPDYLLDSGFWMDAFFHMGQDLPPERLMSFIRDDPLQFAPGEACSYCNSNFIVLGMVIEQVTGNLVEIEIRNRIVEPLALEKTFLDVQGGPIGYLSQGYADAVLAGPMIGVNSTLLLFLLKLVTSDLIIEGNTFDGTYLLHPSLFWTTGSLISNPEDQVILFRALFDEGLVSAESLGEMMEHESCDVLGSRENYGAGFEYVSTEYGDMYGHGGWNFGYYSAAYHMPGADLTYSQMHNFIPAQKEGLGWELRSILLGGARESREVCLPPEDFFDSEETKRLVFRFKGVVNEAGIEEPVFGFSNAKTTNVKSPVLYHGAFSWAEATADGVAIESFSPSTKEGFDYQAAFLNLDENILSDLRAAPLYEFGEGGVPDLTLNEVITHAPDGKPVKTCVTGVPDPSRLSRIYACDHDKLDAAPGRTIKVFGTFPFATNWWAVKDFLAQHGRTRCLCRDDAGVWQPCN